MGPSRTETFGRERLLPLDMMRGAAALMVASSHAVAYGTIPVSETAPLCVVFFFILSGFVLAHAYGTAITRRTLTFRDFFVVRIARLYPLHLVTMSAVTAFWIAVSAGKSLTAAFNLPPIFNLQTECGPLEFVEGLGLIHFVLGGRPCFNSPSWSISVEFWGSFLVFLILRPNRWLRWACIVLGLTGFVVAETQGGFLHAEVQWIAGVIEKNYAVGFGCFIIGWCLHENQGRFRRLIGWVPPSARVAFATALFALAMWSPAHVATWKWIELPFIAAFSLAILLCARLETKSEFVAGLMERTGDLSYGIYLWHVPSMIVVTTLARTVEKLAHVDVFRTVFIDLGYYPLLLALATVGYRRIELPAKHWLRSRFGSTRKLGSVSMPSVAPQSSLHPEFGSDTAAIPKRVDSPPISS